MLWALAAGTRKTGVHSKALKAATPADAARNCRRDKPRFPGQVDCSALPWATLSIALPRLRNVKTFLMTFRFNGCFSLSQREISSGEIGRMVAPLNERLVPLWSD